MNNNKQVIVITGGAGFLGTELVNRVIADGNIAIIADQNVEKGNELAKSYDNAFFQKLDINSTSSIETLISNVCTEHGQIDALINNAYPRNKNYGRHFFDVEYEDFCENVNLNLGGYFLTSQCFAKYFEKNNKGNIVNISSIYGVIPPKFEIYENTTMTMPVEYSVIKSGLIHLTKYMANFLKGKNIRVNCISPGGLIDNQPEEFLAKYKSNCLNKGMLETSDIVGSVSFLLSEDSKFINGQNIVVDDGFCL